ncbi:hypothetical protein L4C34_17110 [Vibrio profundum]|uniref:hypothetical protein n=1 Tax=Vibrio profundum TaxID=2910247 RepID=UPI003D0A6432
MMTQRNIHGEWTMSVEDRLVRSKVSGSTNKELSLAWLKDLKTHLSFSSERELEPWVLLLDCREWVGASQDAWETNNRNTDWMADNHCIFEAIVLPGKMQLFAAETELNDQSIIHYFFSYGDALQACLDQLTELHHQ